jgi:hypothetical protein
MKKLLQLVALGIFMSFLVSCAGEDGDVGPQGPAGANGIDGKDGVDGKDATSDLEKYGNIMIFLDGTRPDGIVFKDTMNFKYYPTTLENNSMRIDENGEQYFEAIRHSSLGKNMSSNEGRGFVKLEFVAHQGTGTIEFKNESFVLEEIVETDDNKAFQLETDDSGGINYLNFSSEYSYNVSTGNLKLKFSMTIPPRGNTTRYDLKVTGIADVIVKQQIVTTNRTLSVTVLSKQDGSNYPSHLNGATVKIFYSADSVKSNLPLAISTTDYFGRAFFYNLSKNINSYHITAEKGTLKSTVNGFLIDKYFASQSEIDSSPSQPNNPIVGDIKYKDLNQDAKLIITIKLNHIG